MPEMGFLKMLIFSGALWKLRNWVNLSIFSYLKFINNWLKDGNVDLLSLFVVENKFINN